VQRLQIGNEVIAPVGFGNADERHFGTGNPRVQTIWLCFIAGEYE
jgi:hypothetical protein